MRILEAAVRAPQVRLELACIQYNIIIDNTSCTYVIEIRRTMDIILLRHSSITSGVLRNCLWERIRRRFAYIVVGVGRLGQYAAP